MFLTVFVYAVLVMLQGEAAQNLGNDSSLGNSTSNLLTEPRTGKGDCSLFCNTLFKALKLTEAKLSECLDKCDKLHPVSGQIRTGNPLCDVLTAPRNGRGDCAMYCNSLFKAFPDKVKLSECVDICKELYPN